jgi:8-oxo-dGTP diphosphatase
MTRFALQFGQTQPGLVYQERATVYGVCASPSGDLALAEIGPSGGLVLYDLPGGGLEASEDEATALIREFQEETGLLVRPERLLCRAGQYWINQGAPRNSLASFYRVTAEGEPSHPAEPDHRLVWMSPEAAIKRLRHEAHAWAVACWLRGGADS